MLGLGLLEGLLADDLDGLYLFAVHVLHLVAFSEPALAKEAALEVPADHSVADLAASLLDDFWFVLG